MSERAVFPHRSHVGLRAARLRRQMSQDELAFRSGVSQPRLSRAERGYLWLETSELEAVAKILDVPPATLNTAAAEKSA